MTATVLSAASLLDAALYYASLDWPVVPIHSVDSAGCSCRKPDCSDRGKHPRTPRGLNDASTESDVIRGWWARWPTSNIGIRADNIAVLDIDKKNGGFETLRDLEMTHGALPVTARARTGGGGEHIVFAGQTKNSVGRIGNGVDTRGSGGYFIAAPSVHESGSQYTWTTPPGDPLAPLPVWVNMLLGPERRGPSEPMADTIIKGGRNDALYKLACSDRARGRQYNEIFAAVAAINQSRCNPPLDDIEIRKIVTSACKHEPGTGGGFAVAGQVITSDDVDSQWKRGLVLSSTGGVKKITGNAALYLMHHEAWRGKLFYDEFAGKYHWREDLASLAGFAAPKAGEAHDHHYSYVQQWLAFHTGAQFAETTVCSAITLAARQNAVHPVREYQTRLEWDRVPRVSRWLSTYMGAKDTPYIRQVGQWWMIAAVARIQSAGSKVDSLLIFEGAQGKKKSTAIEVLTTPWFSDTPLPLGDKDAYSNIQGRWVVELAELAALKGTGASKAKAFFSSRTDRFRPAFERSTRDFPRQCVFIGSTNEGEYLQDPTGGRRFWPVLCGAIDIPALTRDRDQLWAEAVELYRTSPVWWPETEDEVRLCAHEQELRYSPDVWEDVISEFISSRQEVTVADILIHIGVGRDKWEQGAQNRIAKSLRHLGWISQSTHRGGQSVRVYRAATATV